jgi:hypothetical protein
MIEMQLQFAAGTEEIFLRDVEVVGGDAAIVGEVAVDIGGPRVLRHHDDVDDAVMRRSGGDRGALEKIELPEISLRLRQLCRIERIAFFEEQEAPKERHPGPHGEDIRPSIETAVPRFLGAEQRNGVDADGPDPKRRRTGDRQHQVQYESQHAGKLRWFK